MGNGNKIKIHVPIFEAMTHKQSTCTHQVKPEFVFRFRTPAINNSDQEKSRRGSNNTIQQILGGIKFWGSRTEYNTHTTVLKIKITDLAGLGDFKSWFYTLHTIHKNTNITSSGDSPSPALSKPKLKLAFFYVAAESSDVTMELFGILHYGSNAIQCSGEELEMIALLANTRWEEYINQKDFYMLRAKTRRKNNVRLLRRKLYVFISLFKTTFIVGKQ